MGAAPKNWGQSQPPGAEIAPSPRGLGGWVSPQPQPPENRGLGGSPRGRGAAPGGWGHPRGWGQPRGLAARPRGLEDVLQPLETARTAGAGGKITLEETVFGIMKRNPFKIYSEKKNHS